MDNRFLSCESQGLLALIELDPEETVASIASANQSAAAQLAAMPQIEGFRVTGRLGRGGMGTVWRAVQLRTRRDVALKLLNSTAFESDHARQRFEREVELSARLEHPNIARVYDSGTSGGIYFYAMELIDGVHLDEYVAQQRLNQPQILSLMHTICLAVNHAHQRGIIHRDLKPSNILVAQAGEPHVVDFGLARVLESSEAGRDAALTAEGQMAGTLAFMAPEQAAGQNSRLDTRTDVYGLGATMYLLLVGQPAHDQHGPRYQVVKRVADDDVQAPRLLNRDVDTELEAMLLKALDREPDRRYGSAGELAQDISRYLNDEPMEAVPPSSLYKLRKFARKHRAAMSVAAGFVGLLVLATAISSWQAVRATRARGAALRAQQNAQLAQAESEKQAARANVVSDFMINILSSARPASADHTMYVMDLLDAVSKRIGTTLKGQPEEEIRVQSVLARAYHQMGFSDLAAMHTRRALKLAQSLPGGANSELSLSLASQLHPTPTLAPGDANHAVRLAQETYDAALAKFRPDHSLMQDAAMSLAAALTQRANRVLGHDQDMLAAEKVLRSIVPSFDQPPSQPAPPVSYRAIHQLCWLLIEERRFREASEFAATALERAKSDPSCLPLDRAYLHSDLVDALASDEKLKEASDAAKEALDYDRKNLGTFHEVTQTLMRRFVDVLRRSGDKSRASQLIEEDLRWARVLYPEDQPFVADLLRKLARIQMDDGDERGITTFAQAAAMQKRIFGPENFTARILAREVLLTRLGSTKQAPDGRIGTNVFCGLEDLLRDNRGELIDPTSVSPVQSHYAVAQWQPQGERKIVSQGSLADIPEARKLEPGIYLLSLDLPVKSSQPLHQAMWLLAADWSIKYYDGYGVGRFSPHAWPAILASHEFSAAAPSLAFASILRHRPAGPPPHLALVATTKIDLPAGRYRFSVTSDDGARLWVDGKRVIDAWSIHAVERDFADVELDPGQHTIAVDYFEEGDRYNLWVTVEPRSTDAASFAASFGGHPRRSVATALEQTRDSARPEALAATAVLYALTAKAQQAAAAYAAAIDLDPTDPIWWQNRTLLSLHLGDQSGYRDWRNRMLHQFPSPTDRIIAARTAIVALMDQTAAVDQETEALLANLRRDDAPPSQSALCQLAHGIGEYRAGRFESAANDLQDAARGRLTPEARAAAQLFVAMALRRLDRDGESAMIFSQATKAIASLPTADQDELDATETQDRLVCQLAQREAAAQLHTAK
jgi:tetratricopeptide (TPR) repeat protein/predicted Ser/Thr protein kinase